MGFFAGRLVAASVLSAVWGMPASAGTAAPPAKAQVVVRAGDHGTFSRIVFVLPPGTTFKSEQLGDLLVLIFPGGGQIPGLQKLPPYVQSVTGGAGQAAIGLKPGQHTIIALLDQRVVIDIYPAPKP